MSPIHPKFIPTIFSINLDQSRLVHHERVLVCPLGVAEPAGRANGASGVPHHSPGPCAGGRGRQATLLLDTLSHVGKSPE
jgi:hypothetical protein